MLKTMYASRMPFFIHPDLKTHFHFLDSGHSQIVYRTITKKEHMMYFWSSIFLVQSLESVLILALSKKDSSFFITVAYVN